ncbi:MAG: omptin family outer membrane protease [Treponema sp.]|nr:omptin family outer membrane protease [Treponema sp.]
MKKIFFLFLLSLTFPLFPIAAQIFCTKSGNWHLSVEPRVGMTWGHLGEYWYQEKSTGGYKKNSYLEWKEEPLWTYGVGIDGGYHRFNMRLYFDAGIPSECGKMYDSDWKSNDQSLKTTLSEHDLTTTENIQTGISLGFDFLPKSMIQIAPVANVEYSFKNFKAENGSGWHGERGYSSTGTDVAWNDPAAKYYRRVCDIEYYRHSLYIFAGFRILLRPTERLNIAIAAFVSPYTYAYARDIHYSYDNETKTQFKGAYYVYIQNSYFDRFKGYISVCYALNSTVELGLTVSGLVGDVVKSDLYDSDEKERLYIRTNFKGGLSIYEASVKLSAKVHIF